MNADEEKKIKPRRHGEMRSTMTKIFGAITVFALGALCAAIVCIELTIWSDGASAAADYTYTVKSGDKITIVVSDGATVPTVPTVPVVPTMTPFVGLNLEDVNDWNRARPFADLMKSARCIEGNPATGASKWRVLTVTDNVAPDGKTHGSLPPAGLAGTYALTFTGGGVVGASVGIQTNATSGEKALLITGESNVDLSFSAPVSGIRLMRPGYTTETFTREFLADVSKFRCLRFMDWMQTNHGGARRTLTWASRPARAAQSWTDEYGVPIEVIVDLCNAAKTDMWLCIPHEATDDYVKGLAGYLKANYSGVVYFEFSNEVWNGIFPQHQASIDGAKSWTTPTLQPAQNEWYAARHWTWAQIVRCSDIFRSVYGDLSKVRPIFADQFASPSLCADTLYWANKVYPNPPAYYVYGIAAAPYYGPSDTSTVDAAVSSIKATLAKRDDWTTPFLPQYRSMANTYGIKFYGYEVGIDSGQGLTNLDTRIALAYDARMLSVTQGYLEQNSSFMDGQIYFWLSSTSSQWGSWGLKDGSTGTTPKWDGALAFLAPRPIPGALTCVYADGKNTVTRIEPPVFYYQNWGTGGPIPRKDIAGTEAKNFTMTATGKYTPVSGVTALIAEAGPTDTANLAAPNTFTAGQAVDIKIQYSGDFSGSGVASLRLWQVVGGVKKPVEAWQLSPN